MSIMKIVKKIFSTVETCPHNGAITLAYRPDIDGLRALAVLSVLLYHAFPKIVKGGFIGVDIFFVISGYLISSIIAQDLEKERFSIVNFYNRRIRRIFPALLLVLFTVFIFGWFVLLPDEFRALGKHIFGGSVYISNFILWRETGYFDIASQLKPLLHLWSLGIEEQFYIVFPILLWLCAKYKYRMPTIILLLCILSFLDNLYLFRKSQVIDFYSPLSRVWELMAGAIISTAIRHNAIQNMYIKIDAVCGKWLKEGETPNDGRNISLLLAITGVVFIFCGLLLSRHGDAYPGWKATLPVLGTAMLLLATPNNPISKYIFSNKILVFIGLISYPLYLWHWPLLSYATILDGNMCGKYEWRYIRIICILLSFILAYITYRFVERPIRFTKTNQLKKAILLFIILIGTGIFGLLVYFNNGFENRYTANYKKIIFQFTGDTYKREEGVKYAPDLGDVGVGYYDAKSDITVAILGDSHAGSAFYGVAEYNAKNNINTLLINDAWRAKENPELKRNKMFEAVIRDNKIKDVFLFYRGVLYMTGDDIDGYHRYEYAHYDKLLSWYQDTVNRLSNAGKNVYFITENPVFTEQPKNYIYRNYSLLLLFKKIKTELPYQNKNDVVEHQKDYIKLVNKIKNATIIYSLDSFCKNNKCNMFNSEGIPLYRDDDHLSFEGSKYQAEDLLSPYLNKIAARKK